MDNQVEVERGWGVWWGLTVHLLQPNLLIYFIVLLLVKRWKSYKYKWDASGPTPPKTQVKDIHIIQEIEKMIVVGPTMSHHLKK